jgi:hypothetical protein
MRQTGAVALSQGQYAVLKSDELADDSVTSFGE